jgi:DNA repair protein RecO (recombination protein O)
MAESIVNGYLINRFDYKVFDEVITFITNDKRISCISLGSKKILSKNNKNMIYGCKSEFQFFQSTGFEKISKLKKVVLLEKDIME